MLGSLGAPELIIIGLIVILLFGVGKISGLGRELGSSIKEFRKAVKDPGEEAKEQQAAAQIAQAPAQPQQQYAPPVAPPQAAPTQAAPQPSGDNKHVF